VCSLPLFEEGKENKMSLLSGLANPYLDALASGFLFGLVVCTSSCLPYIASYIAGINAGFRKGVLVTLIFNLGRITAYGIIGAAIGIFKLVISDSLLLSFQQYSSPAFGIISIAIGIFLLVKTRTQHGCETEKKPVSSRQLLGKFDVGAFTLGLSRGLILCTPLMALLAYSIPFASPVDSFALAVLFGIGTTLSPILLFGGATGWLLNKAPLFRKWISVGGAALLIVLGAVTLFNTIII
jgi:cytochrome c-type biogenesis protein